MNFERLRQACTDSLSLVAEDDAVAGHLLFTSVVVAGRPARAHKGQNCSPEAILHGQKDISEAARPSSSRNMPVCPGQCPGAHPGNRATSPGPFAIWISWSRV